MSRCICKFLSVYQICTITCPLGNLIISHFVITLPHPDVIVLKGELLLHGQSLEPGYRSQQLCSTSTVQVLISCIPSIQLVVVKYEQYLATKRKRKKNQMQTCLFTYTCTSRLHMKYKKTCYVYMFLTSPDFFSSSTADISDG